ncbi:MAG: lysylphosphatidylglycerol synthase domain-containing protein [Longimicrobiales bacterium]
MTAEPRRPGSDAPDPSGETQGRGYSARRAPGGRSWAWRTLQLLLIAAVTWGVYRTLGPELRQLSWAQLRDLNPAPVPLVISTAVLFGVYLSHAFLWRRIMTDLAMPRLAARETLRVYFIASLGRYLPGKLWQLAGLAVLAARAGLSAGGAAAAAVIGQIAFLTTGLLFLAFLLPRLAGGVPAIAAAVVIGAAGIAIALLLATGWGRTVRDWVLDHAPEATRPRLRSAATLASRVRHTAALTWAAGYAATWIALGVAFSVFVSAFVPDALLASRYLAGTIAASYLWGYLMVITPAGLGVREIAMGGLLAQIPGLPVAAVIVVPIASRLWFTAAEILPLALVPVLPRGQPIR